MNAMVPMYVYTTNFFHGRVEAMNERIDALKEHQKDRGASAIEYVGTIILAAVVIAAIAWAFRQFDIGQKVSDAVNKIFNPNVGKQHS